MYAIVTTFMKTATLGRLPLTNSPILINKLRGEKGGNTILIVILMIGHNKQTFNKVERGMGEVFHHPSLYNKFSLLSSYPFP